MDYPSSITTLQPSVTDCQDSVARAKTHLERAAKEVVWQVQNKAWETLGYRDWDEMREAEYGGAAIIVPRADRPELVAALRREGQTQAQIADTIGVGEATVHRDLKLHMKDTGEAFEPIVDSIGRERPAFYVPRQSQPPAVEPVDRVTGEVLDNDYTPHDPYDSKPYNEPEPSDYRQPYSQPSAATTTQKPAEVWSAQELELRDKLEQGKTVVVNMRGDVHGRLWAWAERNGHALRVDRKSAWGNPFLLDEDGDRDQVCDLYASVYYPHKPSLHKKVEDLAGKALGCWCAPQRCHADFLARQASE